MKIVAIIPARMASTRFPGKPLADILGLPMIEHVRRRASLTPFIEDVIVATCDREIYDVVVRNGGKSVMTSAAHERCTDRIAEAALSVEADVIINVQGDEPLIRPEMLEALLLPFSVEDQLVCANLMSAITDDEEFYSGDVVKVVCDREGNAIYFSREPIPSPKKSRSRVFKKYKQLGIIAFRKDFLHRFAQLPQTPLERVESVDMLRAVEHGYKVRMVMTPFETIGVDTPEDLERVILMMRNDNLFGSY